MGRPERPVDPSGGEVQRLAQELRQVRQQAGRPSYRELSRRAHYSAAALSEAASGRKLPTLAVTLAYVRACGADPEVWTERWHEVAAAVDPTRVAAPAGRVGPDGSAAAPYRGLAPFQAEHADWFFGREAVVADVVKRLSTRPFLAVFGATGAGKSSLLRAGLVPAADRLAFPAGATPVLLTPGEHPLAALTAGLAGSGGTAPAAPRLLVVDQFEELFTLCRDEPERVGFVDALLDRATAAGGDRVVLGVRADFYPHCAEYPRLVAALADSQLLLGPMGVGELRAAIVEPAARAGLTVAPALVEELLSEGIGRPGALPMVSHALLETWVRRHGATLTLAGYRESGGIDRAIAQTAESVYIGLPDADRPVLRRILLRLVAVGEGTGGTRRRASPAELEHLGPPGVARQVLGRLADARLVVLDGESAEVAHEALITAWPRLGRWLDQDRAGLLTLRRLTEAADIWAGLGRDPGALYRGVRLATAREWARHRDGYRDLNPRERDFLAASDAAEVAEQAAARRRGARRRALVGVLAGLVVASVVLAGVALAQRREAQQDRREATSRQLAAAAEAVVGADPAVSALLGVEALRAAPTVEARGTLLSLSARQAYLAGLVGHTSRVSRVAFSPDGTLLASASADGTVALWRPASRERIAVLSGHAGGAKAVAFHPDGRTLVSAGSDGRLRLWDVRRHSLLRTITVSDREVAVVAVSADGRTVAAAGDDGQVSVWDTGRWQRRAVLPGRRRVTGLAFGPGGRTLARTDNSSTLAVWDLATGRRAAAPPADRAGIHSVAYSPDGGVLGYGRTDGAVVLWDLGRQRRLATLTGHQGLVSELDFSPDGRLLTSASQDRTVAVWHVGRRTRVGAWANPGGMVYAAAFSPDGRTVASGAENQAVTLWDVTALPLTGHTDWVNAVAVGPDGRTVASGGSDRRVILWDRERRVPVATLPHADGVTAVAFSPDGALLAAATGTPRGRARTIVLWDLARRTVRGRLVGHTDLVTSVAVSPDGRQLASGSEDETVRLWSLADPARPPVTLAGHSERVNAVAFSPDGRLLASASRDRTVAVWDVARRVRTGQLTGHAAPVRSVAFTPDGTTLASGGVDKTIRLWDVPGRRPVATLTGHSDVVAAVAVSPDGALLASAGEDRRVGLFDLARRTRLAVLTGHTGAVHTVAFGTGPAARTLFTGAEDAAVRSWGTDVRAAADHVCRTVARSLTGTEWSQFLPGMRYRQTC